MTTDVNDQNEQIMGLVNLYRGLKKSSPERVIKTNRLWWVFLDGAAPIRVETEDEAVALLTLRGEEVAEGVPLRDIAHPVKELVMNRPLPNDLPFHKATIHPVVLLIHKGKPRRILQWMDPVQVENLPEEQADLRRKAKDDERVLVLQEHGSLFEQLSARWP